MPKIYLTRQDKETLLKMLDDAARDGEVRDASTRDLRREIAQAMEMEPQEIPQDIITMNSKMVLWVDGEDMEVTLVYPADADLSRGRLSVLSPIGTAILGYRQGDSVEWAVPSGTAEIRIKEVLYQPEAAGDHDE